MPNYEVAVRAIEEVLAPHVPDTKLRDLAEDCWVSALGDVDWNRAMIEARVGAIRVGTLLHEERENLAWRGTDLEAALLRQDHHTTLSACEESYELAETPTYRRRRSTV